MNYNNLRKAASLTMLGILSLSTLGGILSPKASASDNNDVPYGKTFYTDYPAAQSDPLGASQHFHIFANKAVLNAHTDGVMLRQAI